MRSSTRLGAALGQPTGSAVAPPPPVSDTGVETPPSVGWGWLKGTLRGRSDDVLAILSEYFGTAEERPGGLRWYRHSADVGDLGVRVAWAPRTRSNRADEVMFDVPQRALDTLGWQGAVKLAGDLLAAGARFSRVDAYLDDRARVADPELVLGAFRAGHTLSHTRTWDSAANSEGGFTAYLGSRASDLLLRVYRRWVVTRDDRDGVRWELEAKGERSHALALLLVAADVPGAAVMGAIRGLVDFRERRDSHPERAPLLDWWERLVGLAERTRLAAARRVDTLAARLRWLREQVAPSLALAWVAQGDDVLRELVASGERRLRPRQWAMAGVVT
jgi:hypothetical protein